MNIDCKFILNELWAQVLASTVVGDGPATTPLNVSTSKETPVLLIFTSNHLWLADVDLRDTFNRSESNHKPQQQLSNCQELLTR